MQIGLVTISGGAHNCDATSDIRHGSPWKSLMWSPTAGKKVLGGEGAHGMLILSPRAVQRLESYTPPWPFTKRFFA